jgi:hypothetical protein
MPISPQFLSDLSRRSYRSRFVFRTINQVRMASEVARTLPRDLYRPKKFRVIGFSDRLSVEHVALYVHYSATGRVSRMVINQLIMLADQGFSTVFLTSNRISERDRLAVEEHCMLVVKRKNFGFDFGAWQSFAPELVQRGWATKELLLINDSVLGPICPMNPVFNTLRSGGDGLFGLTESMQISPHLQSYFLLARGSNAINDVIRFLSRLYTSHSKWLTTHLGEVGLSRWMRSRGHRVAALYSYARVLDTALSSPTERSRLAVSHRRLAHLEQAVDNSEQVMHDFLLNPTHHMWHVLIAEFGFPYIKTDLIRRNPAQLPGVAEEWTRLVPPTIIELIRDHLTTLDG